MTERAGRRADRKVIGSMGAGVSALALLCAAQPALAQDDATPTKPLAAGSQGTTSGTPSVAAGTATTAVDQAGATTGTSGASQAAPVTPPDTEREEIVVTGVRQSLATAQNIKKNSDTVVDAITAQDIGALPDRSVNEALQRVPGVAISRFAAPSDSQHFSVEGSGVVIRGLSYVRGEFNGRDTFATSGGREIGFNDVPAELIGSVEVFKNLTPDLIEGGISGTVNINTRKPFDQQQRLIYLSGSMNYGDLEKRGAPSVVGLYSQQWDTDGGSRFGILASGSYSQLRSRSDSVFISAYLPRFNDDRNGNGVQDAGEGRSLNAGTQYATTLFDTYPVPAGRQSVYVPMGGGNRTQSFNRERIGVSAAGQFENAAKTVLLTAQYLRTDARQNWIEHTIEPSVGLGDSVLVKPLPGTTPTYDDNGVFTSGSLYRPGFRPTLNNGTVLTQFAPNGGPIVFANRYTEGRSVTQDFSFNAKIDPVERLHLNFDAQYVDSFSDSIDDNVGTTSYGGFGLDVTGKTPRVVFQPQGRDAAEYFANPTAIYFHDAMNNRSDNDGHEYAFRGDARYDVSDDSFLRKVAVGGRYAKRDQTVRTNDYNNWGALSETWTNGGPQVLGTAAAGSTELFSYTDFFRNKSTNPPSTLYISDATLRDHDALTALLRTAAAAGGGSYVPLQDRTGLVDDYFRSNEYYRNKETTISAYARADFGIDDLGGGMALSGNIGVRFVRTKDQSFGALTLPTNAQIIGTAANTVAFCANPSNINNSFCALTPAQQSAALAFANAASFPDVASQSFNHWLPALNIKLQATEKLQFRFAGSKAISRPSFGDLRNFTGVTPNSTGSFGFQSTARNPFLRPVEAKQFDLTAEWYFAKVGTLSGALFYKQLSNIILDNYGYNRSVTNNGQTFDVLVNGPANAPGKGNVKGAELSYQQTYDFLPGILSGLGTQATFTYVDPGKIPNGNPSNADASNAPPVDTGSLYANLPLAGLSKYNFNLAAFYDKSSIYARVAYSWRSKFLLTNRDCCFPFLPVYALAAGQMDASMFFTVNKNFKIGVEAQNLLNTVTKTAYLLTGDGQTAPRSSFISDRQFSVTTRLTF